jgi:hypothetical protein
MGDPRRDVVVWRKSSFSTATGECVEVALSSEVVGVRDSKNPNGPTLNLAPARWCALLRTLD